DDQPDKFNAAHWLPPMSCSQRTIKPQDSRPKPAKIARYIASICVDLRERKMGKNHRNEKDIKCALRLLSRAQKKNQDEKREIYSKANDAWSDINNANGPVLLWCARAGDVCSEARRERIGALELPGLKPGLCRSQRRRSAL